MNIDEGSMKIHFAIPPRLLTKFKESDGIVSLTPNEYRLLKESMKERYITSEIKDVEGYMVF